MKKDIFEELIVVKRSGQRVSFNNYKIAVAIKQAFDHVYGTYNEKEVNKVYEDVLKYIETNYVNRRTINVEDIQDIIENKLKEEKHYKVYKAFSEYRQKRAASRQVFKVKQQSKFIKAMEKIAEDNALRSENNYKPKDLLNHYGKNIVKGFSKSYLIDNKYLRAHDEGNIYLHDMELFPLGVLSSVHLNLKNILETDNSLNNLLWYLLKVKDEINGEINIPALDFLLENWVVNNYRNYFHEYIIKYLKITGFYEYVNIKKILDQINKEKILEFDLAKYQNYIFSKQVEDIFKKCSEDAIAKTKEDLLLNLTNVFQSLDEEQSYSISFGTNFSILGEFINSIILESLKKLIPLKNLKIIFKIKKNQTKYLSSISEIIKNGEILITFIDNSFNKDNLEVEYFADGTRLFENINTNNRESVGRMIVARTSLNLTRLGLKYRNSNIKEFYGELTENLELVKNNLLLSFETIGNKTKVNYQILFNNNILDDEKLEEGNKIRKVIKNGVLLIGIVGLKECVLSFTDDINKQFKLVTEILEFINKKCREFENDTKLNFQIYEPVETMVRKEFMALDKAIYGINKNITEDSKYDLISNLSIIKEDYKKQSILQKLFIGGNLLEINIPANSSEKRIVNLLENLIDSDIGSIKIKVGKKD